MKKWAWKISAATAGVAGATTAIATKAFAGTYNYDTPITGGGSHAVSFAVMGIAATTAGAALLYPAVRRRKHVAS